MAGALRVAPSGVVFTAGGTEADNLAVLGAVAVRPGPVVVSAVEHEAVLRAAAASGQEVRVAKVDKSGTLDVPALAAMIDPSVSVVSVMLVNNEVGTVQPLADVLRVVRRKAPQAVVHTDAVQAVSWLDVSEAAAGADLVSISAHKFGGPQGVGALAVGERATVRPVIHGGGQEQERRSGTHNVAGIAGIAAALEAVVGGRSLESARVAALRERLWDTLADTVPRLTRTTSAPTTPAHLHVLVDGVESEALLVLLDQAGVCASAGSACASGALDPSHVLLAMGVPEAAALGSLRLTLGHTTTEDEVDLAAKAIAAAVSQLREQA